MTEKYKHSAKDIREVVQGEAKRLSEKFIKNANNYIKRDIHAGLAYNGSCSPKHIALMPLLTANLDCSDKDASALYVLKAELMSENAIKADLFQIFSKAAQDAAAKEFEFTRSYGGHLDPHIKELKDYLTELEAYSFIQLLENQLNPEKFS